MSVMSASFCCPNIAKKNKKRQSMSQGSEISLANLPVDVNLRSSYHAMANLLLIRHSAANSNMSG